MSQFTKIIIRCEVDVTSRDPFRDLFTGVPPQAWWGVGVEFQFGFFKGSGANRTLLDISDFAIVKALVTAGQTSSAPLAIAIAPLLDTGLTLDEWTDGVSARNGFERAAHAIVSFLGSEFQFDLATATKKAFWLTVHGATDDEPTDPDCFGCSTLTVIADALPATEGAVQAGNLIPALAAYDADGNYTLNDLTINRVYKWSKNANDTSVVNGTETLVATGVITAQGATVTLTGTALALVTATVWPNPTLGADDMDARYLRWEKPLAFADGIPLILADDGLCYKIKLKKTPNGLVTVKPDQAGVAGLGFRKVPIFCAEDGLYHDLSLVLDEDIISFTINQAGYSL